MTMFPHKQFWPQRQPIYVSKCRVAVRMVLKSQPQEKCCKGRDGFKKSGMFMRHGFCFFRTHSSFWQLRRGAVHDALARDMRRGSVGGTALMRIDLSQCVCAVMESSCCSICSCASSLSQSLPSTCVETVHSSDFPPASDRRMHSAYQKQNIPSNGAVIMPPRLKRTAGGASHVDGALSWLA